MAVVLVPLSAGSSSTSAPIARWASWSALVIRASWSAPSGAASSSRRSSETAVAEAMSPRAAPPTPSQTLSSQGPAYPESWLSLRTRPTSEIAE